MAVTKKILINVSKSFNTPSQDNKDTKWGKQKADKLKSGENYPLEKFIKT